MNSKPHIAFIGLGTMGTGMVHRLLGAGYSVSVYNRTPERAAAVSKEGAHVAGSPREAAEAGNGADVLISMVADDGASRGVWLGDKGALAGAKKGAVCIDCSTLTVAWVRELAAAVQAKGLAFLDAPVTGTKPHAANGELTFLVGGEAAVLEKVRPMLAVMSKETVHLGPTGAGAAFKLVNNFMCGVQAAALAEGFAMLKREGLHVAKAVPLLLNGAPGSPLVKTLAGRHGNKDYTVNFQLKLMGKDLAYAVAEAGRSGLSLETAKAASRRFDEATAAGLGDQDMAAVIKYVEGLKT